MKKCALFIVIMSVFVGCNNKEDAIAKVATDTGNYTNIVWIDSIKNIGSVVSGKKTQISFKFKNTGEKPLYIIAARPGCGCTVADYPKQAIAPNSSAAITAEYSAPSNSSGDFRKNIVVTTNTKGSTSHFIFFYGKIQNQDSVQKSSASLLKQ